MSKWNIKDVAIHNKQCVTSDVEKILLHEQEGLILGANICPVGITG
jgi:hypothetical protein